MYLYAHRRKKKKKKNSYVDTPSEVLIFIREPQRPGIKLTGCRNITHKFSWRPWASCPSGPVGVGDDVDVLEGQSYLKVLFLAGGKSR